MTATVSDKYHAKLAEGRAFEAYITRRFYEERGVDIIPAFDDEGDLGENRFGLEVKLDKRCHETGNLYLEGMERRTTHGMFVPSGIYRKDNTWLFVIGNYTEAWCFGKVQLQLLVKSLDLKTVRTPTSMGYLLPLVVARKHAELTFRGDRCG